MCVGRDRANIPLPGGDTVLERGLKELGLYDASLFESLKGFLGELERWNPRFGFIKATGTDIVVKHVLDSLSGAPFFKQLGVQRVGDLGSGAGFPGIPLALALPQIQFVLIEPAQKKIAFLKTAKSLLGLGNLEIWDKDLDTLRRSLSPEDRFPCLTFRAFAPLTTKELGPILGLVRPGGSIVAYKGQRQRAEEEAKIAEGMGLQAQTIPLRVPFLEEERTLLWISR